jgi:16S rRNA (guanine(966)-N(2))-methyltransferase RsmD
LRVITGKAKGKRLKAPSGIQTRPITDMIKEALFNVIGSDINGAYLLDLFAGSGSVGIEALSRNAAGVIFIDQSINAVKTIEYNLANCKFNNNFEIYRKDVFKALYILHKRKLKFEYIYVDPPFNSDTIIDRVLPAIEKADVLKETGLLIIRTRRQKELPTILLTLDQYRVNNYGDSTLHYYRKQEEERLDDGNI